MDVNIHILYSSIAIFFLAAFFAIRERREDSTVLMVKPAKRTPRERDKRSYKRYKTTLRIKYKTSFEEELSWIKDISRGGARIFLSKRPADGTSLTLEINLPFDTEPIFFKGSIIWHKQDAAGLIFDKAPQRDITRIIEHINDMEEMRSL